MFTSGANSSLSEISSINKKQQEKDGGRQAHLGLRGHGFPASHVRGVTFSQSGCLSRPYLPKLPQKNDPLCNLRVLFHLQSDSCMKEAPREQEAQQAGGVEKPASRQDQLSAHTQQCLRSPPSLFLASHQEYKQQTPQCPNCAIPGPL